MKIYENVEIFVKMDFKNENRAEVPLIKNKKSL